MRGQVLHAIEISLEKPIDRQIYRIQKVKERTLMLDDISVDNRKNAASDCWGDDLNIQAS